MSLCPSSPMPHVAARSAKHVFSLNSKRYTKQLNKHKKLSSAVNNQLKFQSATKKMSCLLFFLFFFYFSNGKGVQSRAHFFLYFHGGNTVLLSAALLCSTGQTALNFFNIIPIFTIPLQFNKQQGLLKINISYQLCDSILRSPSRRCRVAFSCL